MFSFVLVVCLVAYASALPASVQQFETKPASVRLRFDPYDVTWEQFKQDYGKQYKGDDNEAYHKSVFINNVQHIEKHNLDYFNLKTSYYMGINQFTDLTFDEYKNYNKLMKQDRSQNHTTNCTKFMPPLNGVTPHSVNWTAKGYVTPVKDQGDYCGSCWSFSATGSLEGQHFRKTGKLVSLSEQQLMDCSTKFGNHGCHGGFTDDAFIYIIKVGGLEDEADYPYEAKKEKCHFNKSKVATDLKGCTHIPSGDENALMQAVASVGPVSVAIDSTHLHSYAGGVYDDPRCKRDYFLLDHEVLVTGYGSMNGKDYWIVKNSWGATWGDNGYLLMSRNKDNQCGIATDAKFPIV